MKKYVLISLLIIILLGVSFIVAENLNNSVNIGDGVFKLPEKYYNNGICNDSSVNITNGENSFYVKHYDDNNINAHINEYTNYISKISKEYNSSNITLNNIEVCRVDVRGTLTAHYFFTKNNDSYDIYTWDVNENSERDIFIFIQSLT